MSQSLAGLVKVISGWAFPSERFSEVDGMPLIRIRDLGRPVTEVRFVGSFDPIYVIHQGDVLIGMDGDFTVEKWNGEPALLNQRVCKVETISGEIHQGFLYWYLMPHVEEIHRRTPRTTVQHLSTKEIYAIGKPKLSWAEQKVASEILDALDAAIRQTDSIIHKLNQAKQGLLHDLLTRGIDENGELRLPQNEAPHLYKQSPLGWIPNAWRLLRLGDCANVASGVTLGRNVTGVGTVEKPYLRVANVQDGFLDLSEIKTIRIFRSELARFRLEYGDVLMNEGGDFDKLGRGTIWEGQIEDCLHQNHVFRVRCDSSQLEPRYLAAYSASILGKRYFVQASKQTTNLASINSTQLKKFVIGAPTVAEQRAAVVRIVEIESLLGVEKRRFRKLRAVKAGLQDDLLTGRVRVTSLLKE